MNMSTLDPVKVRKHILITLIAAVVIFNLFVGYESILARHIVTDISTVIVAGVVLAFSILVTYRRKFSGLYGKAYLAFAIGMALWFAAEVGWAYDEIVAREETPYISNSAVFWLAGYPFMTYYMLMLAKFLRKTFSVRSTMITSIATAVFVTSMIVTLVNVAGPSTQNEAVLLGVNIAYIAFDGLILAPAILVTISFRQGSLTYIPALFMAISFLITALGDSGYAYSSEVGTGSQEWFWDLFDNTAYVCMAVTLFWHNRFLVYNKNKMKKFLREENR